MARDLIPPVSPAGRPAPDGTPNLIELPPEPGSAKQPEHRPDPGPSQFRNRFGFLLGALAGVFIAAVLAVTAVVATGGDGDDAGLEKNWSAWQPSDTSLEGGAAQIARKVGAEYKHPNGQQLVLVQGGEFPSELRVALRPASGPIRVFEGNGALYQLNGLGPKGSIKGGTPSAERLALIHREALELALYTFRYLPDAEMVVTLLPPPPPDKDDTSAASANPLAAPDSNPNDQVALFYRPGDLKPQLQVPLGQTLAAKAPNVKTMGGPEAKTVETLTQSNIFKWSLPEQNGLLVLDRS
jgi:hypothetical protein